MPTPDDEQARLEELASYDVLDSAPETPYEDLVLLARSICGTSMAGVTLVAEDRQWFKVQEGLGLKESPREYSFCAHAIVNPGEVMVVEDAREDERFADNPLVTGEPHLRFYAGAPLESPEGHGLGSICVLDDEPRSLSDEQTDALEALSRLTMTQLELRRRTGELEAVRDELAGLADELRRRNEQLDRFAGVVAHELQGPLSEVVGQLELLAMDAREELDEEETAYLDQALASSGHMADLIEELLRYARAGDEEIDAHPTDLGTLVDGVIEELGREIDETDGTVRRGELPEVPVEASLIRTVVANLVRNGLKYNDGEPRIEIEAREADGHVRVEVTDDGPGIPEDEQDEIFHVFERGSSSASKTGTGVGLALAERIVHSHGGQMGVDSTPGEGSTFWFTLPADGPQAV